VKPAAPQKRAAATANKCCVSNMPKHQCRQSPHLTGSRTVQRISAFDLGGRVPQISSALGMRRSEAIIVLNEN
jgi:hypothetical protein